MKTKRVVMNEEEIDNLVVSQALDETSWEQPFEVKKNKGKALSLPAPLAERAAFFARIHREKNLENWLERIIQERLDIEEAAFTGFKKEMLTRQFQ